MKRCDKCKKHVVPEGVKTCAPCVTIFSTLYWLGVGFCAVIVLGALIDWLTSL